jgi:hypothetical protein
MTPEQEAMEVWRDALNAARGPGPDFDTADQAAASVILAAFEKREAELREALEEWIFRYYWRAEGMNVEQARIHARTLLADHRSAG